MEKNKILLFSQNHKIKIKYLEKNIICIIFHRPQKIKQYMQKTPSLLIFTKTKIPNWSIHGKKTSFVYLAKPQEFNPFTWKIN